MGWEGVQDTLVGLLTHPIFLIFASLFVFLALAWAVLPFAIYGLRHRLDQIIEALERIQAALDREGGVPPSQSSPSQPKRDGAEKGGGADMLFVDLRKELLQFAPALQERVLDPSNVVLLYEGGGGAEIPCLYLSLRESGVRISFPLKSLSETFPRFSSEQFQRYIDAFLPEKHGYFSFSSPDGGQLHVNIVPRGSNPLDVFVGIVKEQLIERIRGKVG